MSFKLSGGVSAGPPEFQFLQAATSTPTAGYTTSKGGSAQVANTTKTAGVVGEGVGKAQPSQGARTSGGTSQG